MAVIRTKRGGVVINEQRDEAVVTTRTVSRPVVRVWGMSEKAKARPHIEDPSRNQLTAKQWAERGDNVRLLKRYGYEGASELSLAHSRDAVRSTVHCCKLRCMSL